jgi:hypothetical protein
MPGDAVLRAEAIPGGAVVLRAEAIPGEAIVFQLAVMAGAATAHRLEAIAGGATLGVEAMLGADAANVKITLFPSSVLSSFPLYKPYRYLSSLRWQLHCPLYRFSGHSMSCGKSLHPFR